VQGLVGSLGGVVELVWAEVVGPWEVEAGGKANGAVLGRACISRVVEVVALHEAKAGQGLEGSLAGWVMALVGALVVLVGSSPEGVVWGLVGLLEGFVEMVQTVVVGP
jgi:hypothetical protein